MLTGQNGILNRAKEAKQKTGEAQIEENEKLSSMEELIENSTKVGKKELELFDATGEVEGKLHIGDFVNYTPTEEIWTEEDMNKIKATGAKIDANKSNTSLPSVEYQFGGFESGNSKSRNAKAYDSSYAYAKDSEGNAITGWRLFDVADDGTVTLISAGCPEDYYHPNATNSAYISEYILTGNKNSNATSVDFTTYTPRDWTMYENTSLGSVASVLTKRKLDNWYTKYITEGTVADTDTNAIFQKIYNTKYESLIDNYSYYWFSFASYSDALCYINPNDRYENYSNNGAYGVRILVSLPSSIKIISAGNETKVVVSRENTQNYGIWNLSK